MLDFNPWLPLFGGALVGLAASSLLYFTGKIAGISGILARAIVDPTGQQNGDGGWRLSFLTGMIVTGALIGWVSPQTFENTIQGTPQLIIAAGLLVGFGTRLGSGCTSGHGVCGLPRFSFRSLVAVLTFIGTGAVTVALVH